MAAAEDGIEEHRNLPYSLIQELMKWHRSLAQQQVDVMIRRSDVH